MRPDFHKVAISKSFLPQLDTPNEQREAEIEYFKVVADQDTKLKLKQYNNVVSARS